MDKKDIDNDVYVSKILPFDATIKKHINNNIVNQFVAFYIAQSYAMDMLYELELRNLCGEAIESLCQVTSDDCDFTTINEILKKEYNMEIKNISLIKNVELENAI